MKKDTVNKHVVEFTSRFMKNFSINKMTDAEFNKLSGFNIEVYKNEFNAQRFQEPEGISRFWRWKYSSNPSSRVTDNFGWLAEYKGDFIGQFHIIPSDTKIGDNYYRAAWGSDLAMLTKYRNIGISSVLIQHARKEVGSAFSLFLVGGMNPNSYNVFKRSGFINLGGIPRYVKILDLKTLMKSYGLPDFLSVLAQAIFNALCKLLDLGLKIRSKQTSIEMVSSVGEEFEKFWNSVSKQYTCITKRDAAFLKWRYLDQPLWPYHIVKAQKQGEMKGFAVLREGTIKNGRLKGKKIGIISDILLDPLDKKSAAGLLNGIIKIFKNKKVLLIKCDILSKRAEKFLHRSGFIRIKSGNGFMAHAYDTKMPEKDINLAIFRKNWFITSGDSDLDFY